MTSGPTRGAAEEDRAWQASPVLAHAVRIAAFLLPLIGAFTMVSVVGDALYRPNGFGGLLVWFIQAAVVGASTSTLIDRWSRRLLPLAVLFNMSLVFPDQAPSRFGVALRSGSIKRLQSQLAEDSSGVLGSDQAEAARRAVEMVSALAGHDRLTRGHTERVRAYADLIAIELDLSDTDRAKLAWGVLLHDIGKLAVPPEVLNKSEKLTAEEWEILKSHPAEGRKILGPLIPWLGDWVSAAWQHHERWDGGGYPGGLAGKEISLAGRITAVADAYDVITSRRSYKRPMSVTAARKELVNCAGSQFDPEVVRAFLNVSLGRRWTGGPLAVLSDLPLGNLVAAPAKVSVAAIVAAGTISGFAVPTPGDDTLAFVAPEPTVPTRATTTATTATTAEMETTIETETPQDGATTTTPSSTVTTVTAPPTTEPSTSTTTTATTAATAPSTTTAPPTTVATTTTTTPTTTTTTVATTTTTALTTTTAPPTTVATTTTTTTAPTTTTIPAAGHYLKNHGTGDTAAQLFKYLSTDGPDDTSQPNFDTNRDSIAGLRLEPTGSGFAETDTVRIQRYGLNIAGQTVSGPLTATIYVATDSDLGGGPATIRADIADCSGFYLNCTTILGDTTAVTTTWVNSGFEALSFDFGSVNHTLSSNRRLVLRLITEGSETLHVGFDSTENPSAVVIGLS